MSSVLLVNLLALACVATLVSLASAESGIVIGSVEIPWGLISTVIASTTAILALVLRSSLITMKVEFNHQMTAALQATLEKGIAEGVLKEKTRAAGETIARAEGVAEGERKAAT